MVGTTLNKTVPFNLRALTVQLWLMTQLGHTIILYSATIIFTTSLSVVRFLWRLMILLKAAFYYADFKCGGHAETYEVQYLLSSFSKCHEHTHSDPRTLMEAVKPVGKNVKFCTARWSSDLLVRIVSLVCHQAAVGWSICILPGRFLTKLQIAHLRFLGETHVRRREETPTKLTCFTEKLKDRQGKSSLQRRRSS